VRRETRDGRVTSALRESYPVSRIPYHLSLITPFKKRDEG
jgi:hypothetical protein